MLHSSIYTILILFAFYSLFIRFLFASADLQSALFPLQQICNLLAILNQQIANLLEHHSS
jgi:hypothetical protein